MGISGVLLENVEIMTQQKEQEMIKSECMKQTSGFSMVKVKWNKTKKPKWKGVLYEVRNIWITVIFLSSEPKTDLGSQRNWMSYHTWDV